MALHPHMATVSGTSAVAASLVGVFCFLYCCVQAIMAPSVGKQQPFQYAYKFCGSGAWTRHSGDGLLLFHCVWGLKWGDLNSGSWNHLEMSLFMCMCLSWYGPWGTLNLQEYTSFILSIWSFCVSSATWRPQDS